MKVKIRIIPRVQFLPYLQRKQRWAVLVVHRRGGKTFVCIQDLLVKATTHKRPGPPLRYGYIAPTRDQAKDIAWAYLKRYVTAIPGSKINEAELSATLPNLATIRLYSGDSYDRMRGLYFDGVIVDEGADIDPRAWDQVILPCLADYDGWATFIGTPKGRNSFYDLSEKARKDAGWHHLILPASQSRILSDETLRTFRESMTESAYAQELECDFSVALQGAIYARHIEKLRRNGGIGCVQHDPALPVWTLWDLGAPLNTAVWSVQFLRGEIRVLACDAGNDWTTGQRVATMIGRGWDYAGHVIPHDGAATQKSGITYSVELERAGLQNVITLPRASDPNSRINRLCGMIPAMRFDESACEYGLKALENASWGFDPKLKTYSDKPKHDWTSHPCDALGYLAEAIDCGVIDSGLAKPRAPRVISPIPELGDNWRGGGRVISALD